MSYDDLERLALVISEFQCSSRHSFTWGIGIETAEGAAVGAAGRKRTFTLPFAMELRHDSQVVLFVASPPNISSWGMSPMRAPIDLKITFGGISWSIPRNVPVMLAKCINPRAQFSVFSRERTPFPPSDLQSCQWISRVGVSQVVVMAHVVKALIAARSVAETSGLTLTLSTFHGPIDAVHPVIKAIIAKIPQLELCDFESIISFDVSICRFMAMTSVAAPMFLPTALRALELVCQAEKCASAGLGAPNLLAEICIRQIPKLRATSGDLVWFGSALFGDIVNIFIPVVNNSNTVFINGRTGLPEIPPSASPSILLAHPVFMCNASAINRNSQHGIEPVLVFRGCQSTLALISHRPMSGNVMPFSGTTSHLTLSDIREAFPHLLASLCRQMWCSKVMLPSFDIAHCASQSRGCTCTEARQCWKCQHDGLFTRLDTMSAFDKVNGKGSSLLGATNGAAVMRETLEFIFSSASSGQVISDAAMIPSAETPNAAGPISYQSKVPRRDIISGLPGYAELAQNSWNISVIEQYFPPCLAKIVLECCGESGKRHPKYPERCLMLGVVASIQGLSEDRTASTATWRWMFLNHTKPDMRAKFRMYSSDVFKAHPDLHDGIVKLIKTGQPWACPFACAHDLCPFSKTQSREIENLVPRCKSACIRELGIPTSSDNWSPSKYYAVKYSSLHLATNTSVPK